MIVAFELSMPNVGSWNGRWTGERKVYARVKSIGNSAKATKKYSELVGSYYYNFGDGWGASVSVKVIDNAEARRLRRQSVGFAGYDWMIDSIERHGKILNSIQQKEVAA